MNEGWNVILRYDHCFAGMNLWLVNQNRDGSQEVVLPIDLAIRHELIPAEMPPEPTIRFHGADAEQFLQGLCDGLVAAGYKPDELKASDKQLQAIAYHLEDLRRLVFKDK